ncbi:hypothetical protein JCM6882_007874 [Rhodosporidiobolus microsporus]
MADDAPAARSSPFDKLPLELLKRIVELVKEQDLAFAASGLERACPNHGTRVGSRTYKTTPLEGEWSSWCGRGMAALSLVNKLFRGLTFSLLCETVTLKRLASPFFRFKLVHRPEVVASIRTLDARIAPKGAWLTAAPLFPRLSLVHLIVAESGLAVVPPDAFAAAVSDDPSEASWVQQAFQDVLHQVVSVETHDVSVDQLETLMRQLDLPNIRELRILYPDRPAEEDSFSFKEANLRLVPLFQQLVKLETFKLHDEGTWEDDFVVNSSWMNLLLPSLSSATIQARRRCASLCELFKGAAPELRTLRIVGFDPVAGNEPFALPDMPSLRHFTIGFVRAATFTLPPATPLVSLAVDVSETTIGCRSVFPALEALPSSLRLITLTVDSATLPADADSFRADCVSRGIAFRLFWSPSTDLMRRAVPEDGFGRLFRGDWDRLRPASLAAAHETLEWAKGRLEWCERFGDDRTAQEIINSLTRVRERQAIELQ